MNDASSLNHIEDSYKLFQFMFCTLYSLLTSIIVEVALLKVDYFLGLDHHFCMMHQSGHLKRLYPMNFYWIIKALGQSSYMNISTMTHTHWYTCSVQERIIFLSYKWYVHALQYITSLCELSCYATTLLKVSHDTGTFFYITPTPTSYYPCCQKNLAVAAANPYFFHIYL